MGGWKEVLMVGLKDVRMEGCMGDGLVDRWM
jgi:hypothetical protein